MAPRAITQVPDSLWDESGEEDTIGKTRHNYATEFNALKYVLEDRYRGYDDTFRKKWYDHLFLGFGGGLHKDLEYAGYNLSPITLIFRDFKDFNMSGSKVGVGQLELVDLKLVDDMMPALEAELARVKSEEGRHSALLLLTDIMKEGSLLLMVSDDPARIAKAFGKELGSEHLWLDGVMSRKKQVVPALEAAFKA